MDASTYRTSPDIPPFSRAAFTATVVAVLAIAGCDELSEATTTGASLERGSVDSRQVADSPPQPEEVPVVERISPGERAFSVVLETPRAVGGYLRPGDSVDVWMTVSPDRRIPGDEDDTFPEEPLVTSVFEHLPVIAVEQRPESRRRETEEVELTFSVPPEVVEPLEVATRNGELFVTLRHRDDLDSLDRTPRTLSEAIDNIEKLQRQRRDRLEDKLFGCAPGLRPACLKFDEEPTASADDSSYRPAGTRLPTQFPSTHRALTLAVRAPANVAAPTTGDRVDLLGLLSAGESSPLIDRDTGDEDDSLSVDLLQQVQVLAATSSQIRDEEMLLTVAVTPAEIELLLLADSAGRIEALVRPDDTIETPEDIDEPRPKQWRLSELLDDLDQLRQNRDRRFEAAVDALPEQLDEDVEKLDDSGDESETRFAPGIKRRGSALPRHPVSAAIDSARTVDRDPGDEPAGLWTESIIDGERMVAIPVDAFAEETGSVEAGRWIDVVATVRVDEDDRLVAFDESGATDVPMTWTVLQRLAVLDTDDRTVAVSASPDEAHLLAHLAGYGTFRPVLRALDEEGTKAVDRREIKGVFGDIGVD